MHFYGYTARIVHTGNVALAVKANFRASGEADAEKNKRYERPFGHAVTPDSDG
tara:strand:+ start:951 stop:1109 length:159 start_codon:yes stop_codon:yes gene_type:complete